MSTEAVAVVIAAVTLVLTIGGIFIADGRARARNEITAERVAKLEALPDRVTRLEVSKDETARTIEKHANDDTLAIERMERMVREFFVAIRDDMNGLRADVRAVISGREDTGTHRVRSRGTDDGR